LLILRVLAFGIALISLVFAFQRKSRLAVALAVLCLLVGVGTFVMGTTTPEVEAQGKSSSEASVEASISQVELGKQLFIAKGCITCHYNSKVAASSEYWTIETGAPNLSTFSGNPDVLRTRLKDPASVKSDTKMPQLGLSAVEIEALVAFINSK